MEEILVTPVLWFHVQVSGSGEAWSLVETQDAELCGLIDSLVLNT